MVSQMGRNNKAVNLEENAPPLRIDYYFPSMSSYMMTMMFIPMSGTTGGLVHRVPNGEK